MTAFRVYQPDEIGTDGYPPAWHNLGDGTGIKHIVRAEAGHRCERCGHPYHVGKHGRGEWTPCDDQCSHPHDPNGVPGEAHWRILTVHHLTGDKADCRWWNLAALCQRCHLTIQGRVQMRRVYPYAHTAWFKPHAAGWYAWTYLGEDLTRAETLARLDELLALELVAPFRIG